jgi:hypothetical protein
VHPAPVRGTPQPAVELGYREVQGCVEVLGARLGPDDRASRDDGDLHALALVRLARVALVEQLHISTHQLLVVPFNLAQLVGDVSPIVIGNLHVAALDDNVHS